MPHVDKKKSNEYIRQWQANKRAADRDIGDSFPNGFYKAGKFKGCPRPQSPQRRKKVAECPMKFMETYAKPDLVSSGKWIDFTEGQIREIEIAKQAILHGGQYAFAAPRGDGKTTRIEWLTLWAVLNGYHQCVVPVGADKGAADDILENLKFELLTNDLLAADYPEVCIPARVADGRAQRARTLSIDGKSVRFVWGKDKVVFPTIPGSPSSGAIIVPRGLTGRLRGMKVKIEGVGDVRPSLFLLDDPQTDESAKSPTQCDVRESLVLGAVLGSGGGKDRVAAFMPCTIIHPDDLAARFLDREAKPEWHGTTRSLVKTFPTIIEQAWEKSPGLMPDIWKEYQNIRNDDFRLDMIIPKNANAFYREHQDQLEAGAEVDNPQRILPGDVSPLQTAMNYYFDRGREVFFAEYQNTPESLSSVEVKVTPEIVASRVNGFAHREVPSDAAFLVSMADINYVGLNYVVTAFTNDLTGYIVDYGKHPDGFRRLVTKGMSEHEKNQAIATGIKRLWEILAGREYLQHGERRSIDVMLYDANYWTHTVLMAIRSMGCPRIVMADRGTESKKYRPAREERMFGTPKYETHVEKASLTGVLQVRHNADYWRMFAQKAFLVEPGIPGSLSIYGDDPQDHTRLAEEVCGEILRRYVPGDPDLYAWDRKPGVYNDLLDAVVGCYPAAVNLGATPPGQEQPTHKRRRRRTRRVGTAPTMRTRY